MIGYAGSDEKVKWLKEELGFDFAFNYKKVDLHESLKEVAPEGVDVYFDVVRRKIPLLALKNSQIKNQDFEDIKSSYVLHCGLKEISMC